MSYTEFDEFDKSPKGESFHDLWLNQSDSTVVETPGFDKQASGGNPKWVERGLMGTTWAGSDLPLETLELREHIAELTKEKYDYPVLESKLEKLGYRRMNIRQQFQEVTGIDPVLAYMDVEAYSKAPPLLPKYNYGWGEAKGKFYFVLPFTLHYAVWEQAGIERNVHSEHVTLTEARKALKEIVGEPNDITPQMATSLIQPVVRIAQLSDNALTLLESLESLPVTTPIQTKIAFLRNAVMEEKVLAEEAEQIISMFKEADGPDTPSEKKQVSDDFDQYRGEVEQTTVDDALETMKVPQHSLDQTLERSHQLSTVEVVQKAFKKLQEIGKQLQGFEVKPTGHTVDLKDVEFFADEGREQVDTGHISFICDITDKSTNQKATGLVIMFVVNGELTWAGKLKGSNNKEYALSQPGLEDYFMDLSGYGLETPIKMLPDENHPAENATGLTPSVAPTRY